MLISCQASIKKIATDNLEFATDNLETQRNAELPASHKDWIGGRHDARKPIPLN